MRDDNAVEVNDEKVKGGGGSIANRALVLSPPLEGGCDAADIQGRAPTTQFEAALTRQVIFFSFF